MDIIEKINENRNEDLNLMNSLIKNLYFNHCSDLSEINQILNVEHLNIKLPLIEKIIKFYIIYLKLILNLILLFQLKSIIKDISGLILQFKF